MSEATLAPEVHQLDWFVGTWEVKSRMKTKDGWIAETAISTIEPILEGHALLESYDGVLGGEVFHGKSIRVYNPKQNQWEQAWIDTSGRTVVVYIGYFDTEKREFVGQNREAVINPNAERRSRETFFNITESAFFWKLESSKDGQVWEVVWELDYTRR